MEQTASFTSFVPLIVIFVLFYFLLIKPQQKKALQRKKMIESLSIGDELVLTSGIICKIENIPANKDYIFVCLDDNTVVRVFKDAIADKYEEVQQKEKDNANTRK